MPPALSAGSPSTISPYYGYAALGVGALSAITGRRSRFGQSLGGAASGAMTGFALGGPVGAAIGGGLGLLAGALSESPEEQRERRLKAYRARLKEIKQQETTAAIQNISQATEGAQRRMTGGAERRAIAAGRTGDIEEVTAPIAAEIGNRSVGIRTQALADIENRYAQAELGAEQGMFEAPLEPTAVDYLQAIAPAAVDYAGMQKQGELQKQYLDEQQRDSQFYRDLYQRHFGGTASTASPGTEFDYVQPPESSPQRFGQLALPEATTVTPLQTDEYDLRNPRVRRNTMRRLTNLG